MEALNEFKLHEIKDLTKRFLDALKSGDSNTFFSFLESYICEETELITPKGVIISGNDLIPFYHGFFDPIFQDFQVDGGFKNDAFFVSGELGVHRYSYEIILTPNQGGANLTETGHGIKTYKKHLDGSWRLQYDVWTNPD
jgi:ketosteroid isomerase-like protein